MSKPETDYTLTVSKEDDCGRIFITSPEIPGLLMYAERHAAFRDLPDAVSLLRKLNQRSWIEAWKR